MLVSSTEFFFRLSPGCIWCVGVLGAEGASGYVHWLAIACDSDGVVDGRNKALKLLFVGLFPTL